MTTIILTFVLTLAAVAFGYFARKWHVEHRTPDEIESGAKLCGRCHAGLPDGALKTHTGDWLCRTCKAAP